METLTRYEISQYKNAIFWKMSLFKMRIPADFAGLGEKMKMSKYICNIVLMIYERKPVECCPIYP